MRARTAVAAGLAALLLGACGGSPQADLNSAMAEVTDRANARDASGLRLALDRLVAVVNRQSGSDLPLDEAQRIRALAEKVRADAALLEQPAIPTPAVTTSRPVPTSTRTATPSPTPSATPSPTPSATPSPEPTPTPTPTPTQTPAPTPSSPAAAPPSPAGTSPVPRTPVVATPTPTASPAPATAAGPAATGPAATGAAAAGPTSTATAAAAGGRSAEVPAG